MNLSVRRIKELHALVTRSKLDESTQIKLSESLQDGQDLGLLLDEQNPMVVHALDAQHAARCQRRYEHRAYVAQHFLNYHCGVQPRIEASFQHVVCPVCGFRQGVIGGSSALCFYWNQKVPGPVLAVAEIEFGWPKMGYMLEGRIRWPLILQPPKFEEDQILECIVHNVENKSESTLPGARDHVQMLMNLSFHPIQYCPESKTDSTTYRASLIKPKGAKAERAFLAELTEFYPDWRVERSRH